MEQRRLRPGDVVDDYCPRERRLTDHAVVAMRDDAVEQVRCVSCEAEHEYRDARVPTPRRKRDDGESPAAPSPAVVPPTPSRVEPAPVMVARVSPPEELAVEPEAAEPPAEPVEREESALPMIARRRGDALSRFAFPGWKEQEAEATRPPRHLPDFTVRQPGTGGGRQRGHGRGHGASQPPGPMRSGHGTRDPHRQPQGGGPQGEGAPAGRRRRRRRGRRKPPPQQ